MQGIYTYTPSCLHVVIFQYRDNFAFAHYEVNTSKEESEGKFNPIQAMEALRIARG
jgi:hypothetical protein